MGGKCETCRTSYWQHLVHREIKPGPIAFSTNMVEIMAPLFKFDAWKMIYPYIYKQYMIIGGHLTKTDRGADTWWCGAAYEFANLTGPPCIVINYTPIIHLDTRTINKNKKFGKEGKMMMNLVKKRYRRF